MPGIFDGAAGDVAGIAITLALTFVLGLEREEAGARQSTPTAAGVRTMPIVGLIGHVLTLLGASSALLPAAGLVVVGGFLLVEYTYKLRHDRVGFTTESTALIAYAVGALVAVGRPQAAAALTVATVLLLTSKVPLRRFAAALPNAEIATFVTFLLLAVVILPILPNQGFTRFNINPFQAWLVVVAVSGISYASYVLQKLVRSDQSLLLTALLGGLYSSTATTVALARRSVGCSAPLAYAGGIILATGTMYVRILILLWTFSPTFGARLAPVMVGLAIIGSLAGVVLIRSHRGKAAVAEPSEEDVQHPLEIRAAVVFAALYLGLGVLTPLTAEHLGSLGLFGLALLVGITDIVPFILGLTREIGASVMINAAIVAILLSIASNNIVKGVYALALGDRRTGRMALAGLVALAALTVATAYTVMTP